MIAPVFNKTLQMDTILLGPEFLNKNFKNQIEKQIIEKHEGKCNENGYIRKQSIIIKKIVNGKVTASALNGNVQFKVFFHADVFNPSISQNLQCRVINKNKFGILAHAGILADDGDFTIVAECIVPQKSIGSESEIDIEEIQIGAIIWIQIIGKRFELNDKKINVIGRVIKQNNDNPNELSNPYSIDIVQPVIGTLIENDNVSDDDVDVETTNNEDDGNEDDQTDENDFDETEEDDDSDDDDLKLINYEDDIDDIDIEIDLGDNIDTNDDHETNTDW